MKHIEIIQKPCQMNPSGGHACSECQTSCQSACKTSCTVGNQPCENEDR